MKYLLLLCLLLGALPSRAQYPETPESLAAGPVYSDERVYLHTEYGDIVIALYPEAAPKHYQQILKLVRAGVYNHTPFTSVERDFYLQIGGAAYRAQPLPEELKKIVRPIPAERDPSLKHIKGVVSFTPLKDGDPNSAETSFSIILGDSPHMDGQYTIVGTLERGYEAISRLQGLPLEKNSFKDPQPQIIYADILSYDEANRRADLTEAALRAQLLKIPLVLGLAVIFVLCVSGFFLKKKLQPKQLVSLSMLCALVSFFLAFLIITPESQNNSVMGGVLFFSLLAIFKLMNQFEST